MSKLFDPICEFCENREIGCITPCAPIKWVNGHTARREPLLSDISDNTEIEQDYNQVLAELIHDRENAIEIISKITDIRRRAIASMLMVNISKQDIAGLISISHRRINQIINKSRK